VGTGEHDHVVHIEPLYGEHSGERGEVGKWWGQVSLANDTIPS
jgi:hypothetical protein